MERVTANGVDIAYVESGSGEPFVLIHGGSGHFSKFDLFRPLLGEGIRAIAYGQRDSPDVGYEGGPYGMADHAADCAAFIEALGLERAHIMGTSYGSGVALMTAIEHPERVQSLILACSAPSWSLVEPFADEAVANAGGGDEEAIMLRVALTAEAIANDPVLVAETRAIIRANPWEPERFARHIGAITSWDARGELGRVQAPTLVLHGDADPVIKPEVARRMAEQIPGAEFRLLEGVAHGITIQDRQLTADIMREFILAHPLAGS